MMLELARVSKGFGGVMAVQDVSFRAEPGQVVGIAGPNGAGKTTLFNLVSGMITPDEGTVRLGAARIDRLPPWRIARLGVGRLFQDVRVFPKLTAVENLLVVTSAGASRERAGGGPSTATECLALVGLAAKADHLAENLSYGEQKLLAIGRLLVTSSTVWLLDEPAAGLAGPLIERVVAIVREFSSAGRTVLLVEHDVGVLSAACDRLLYFAQGTLLCDGAPHAVLADPAVRRAYLGV